MLLKRIVPKQIKLLFLEIKNIFRTKIENTNNDEKRTRIVKKNIILSIISKFFTVLLSFIILPLSIKYLNKYQFGVYATINSIVLWVDLFDLGLGQGLRNNLTEAYVNKNLKLAREYISTTYFLVSFIAIVLLAIFFGINHFINWKIILNAKNINSETINNTIIVVFTFFFFRFISNLITKIFFALQYSAWVTFIQFIQKLILLIIIIALLKWTNSSIFLYAFFQSFTLFVTPLIIGMYFFNTKFKSISPKINAVKLIHSKKLMGLGVKFFIIQICLLILFSTNNFLISYFVDPSMVTVYQVAYNLFNTLTVVFMLISTPLWSAYTEAWKLNRYEWIKKTIKKILLIYLGVLFVAIFIFVFSPSIYKYWIGEDFEISKTTSLLVCLLILINLWTRVFDFFTNGISKITLQMYVLLFAAIINIPLSYLLSVTLGLGLNGIILGSIISFMLSAITSPIQTYLLLTKKAKGIWNK